MSKNESNSQQAITAPLPCLKRNKSLTCQRTKAIHNQRIEEHPIIQERNKSLTCQRTKAIHNRRQRLMTKLLSGTNLLHVKERKQFTTGQPNSIPVNLAEQISYMSKNESNSQRYKGRRQFQPKRNKSLTCQRTKAIHNYCGSFTVSNISGTNLLHVKERKQFTTTRCNVRDCKEAEQISYMSKNESNSQQANIACPAEP